jgi:hypothetical protein
MPLPTEYKQLTAHVENIEATSSKLQICFIPQMPEQLYIYEDNVNNLSANLRVNEDYPNTQVVHDNNKEVKGAQRLKCLMDCLIRYEYALNNYLTTISSVEIDTVFIGEDYRRVIVATKVLTSSTSVNGGGGSIQYLL